MVKKWGKWPKFGKKSQIVELLVIFGPLIKTQKIFSIYIFKTTYISENFDTNILIIGEKLSSQHFNKSNL